MTRRRPAVGPAVGPAAGARPGPARGRRRKLPVLYLSGFLDDVIEWFYFEILYGSDYFGYVL